MSLKITTLNYRNEGALNMNVTKIPADTLFRVYTSCPGDPATLILDVRPYKEFKRKHIAGAYSIRLAANGQTLLDYSKNTYNLAWSKDCWWDKHVVIYGEPKLKRDHPVIAFLISDNHAKSVNLYPDGIDVFERHYPFLVTPSIKANASRRYPGEIIPGLLYLGDWGHAQDTDSLDDLKIKRIITVHNNPENLKPPSRFKHLRYVLADVETEDISQYFNESYNFIEEAKTAREAVLVHCGAGVSRSAALCMAYLMRKFQWPAAKARAHCLQRRSIIMPNDGFWRSLCALEAQLGIQQRSDPTAVSGFSGADAPAKLAQGAAGEKVAVAFVPAHKIRVAEAAVQQAGAGPGSAEHANGSESRVEAGRGGEAGGTQNGKDRHGGSHPRDRDSSRERRDRQDRDRHCDGAKRSRSRERHRDRDKGRGEAGSDSRKQARSREAESDATESSKRRRGAPDAEGEAAGEAAQAEPAAVILETSKEGKVLGRLEIGLRTPHQRCVFGRLPSNEVVLEHLSISRQHAQLTLDAAGDLFLTDLGSAHRSNVDGVWVRPKQARALPKGAVFRLGGSTREFKVLMTPRERAKEVAKQSAALELEQVKAA